MEEITLRKHRQAAQSAQIEALVPEIPPTFEELQGEGLAAGHYTGVSVAMGKILVMDDDELITLVLSSMLSEIGYEAVTVNDGRDALEAYAKGLGSDCPFDVVILDLFVPGGMGGRETITRLREIDCGVKAIISSGSTLEDEMRNHEKYGFMAVLCKPYGPEELAEAIRRVVVS